MVVLVKFLLTATLAICVRGAKKYYLNTDGYLFKFQVEVRFKSSWSTDDDPAPIVSPDKAFSLNGAGKAYAPKGTLGHIVFYIQTEANVSPHGRGAPQVISRGTLTPTEWYKVTCEKTLEGLCLWVNNDDPVCTKRTVDGILFKMKGPMPAEVSMASVGNMEARNFKDLSSTF